MIVRTILVILIVASLSNGDYTQVITDSSIASSGNIDLEVMRGNIDNGIIARYHLGPNFPEPATQYQADAARPDVHYNPIGNIIENNSSIMASTCIGGSDNDESNHVVMDSEGNIIVSGSTRSPDFPTVSSQNDTHLGLRDVFISKFNEDLSSVIWSRYLGGTFSEDLKGMVVDGNDDIFLAGSTESNDFPTTQDAFQTSLVGSRDAFICKVNGSSGHLMTSSYFGGTEADIAEDITVTNNGSIIICGRTDSDDLPTTNGTVQEIQDGQHSDGFVSVFNAHGTELLYSSFIGGWLGDRCYGVDVSTDGSILVTGSTNSPDFPVTPGAYQTEYGRGFEDVFVSSLTSDLSQFEFSTYIGSYSGSDEEGWDVIVDYHGDVIVLGITNDPNFPTTTESFQSEYKGESTDVFVTKLDSNGSSLQFSSFLGGSDNDRAQQISIDNQGYIYVTGYTRSEDFPTTEGVFQQEAMAFDAFVCRIVANGTSLSYSTLIGGSNNDFGIGVCEIGNGSVIISGTTNSSDFPTSSSAIQGNISGHHDAFVTIVNTDIYSPHADAGTDQIVDEHEQVSFDGSGSYDDLEISTYEWTFIYDGRTIRLNGTHPTFTFDLPGKYVVELNITDTAGNWGRDTVEIMVRDVTNPLAFAGPDIEIDQHENVTFDGSGSSDMVGIVSYEWTFLYNNETVVLTGISSTFTFDLSGHIVVMLNVTDMAGNWATDLLNVTVNDITPPEVLEDLSDEVPTTGDVFRISVRLKDNVGVASATVVCWYSMNEYFKTNHTMKSEQAPGARTMTFYTDDIVMGTGFVYRFNYYIVFNDTSGNENKTRTYRNDIVDNDRPWLVNDTTPTETLQGHNLTFSFLLEDNNRVTQASVEYWYTNGSIELRENLTLELSTEWSASISIPRGPESPLIYFAWFTDWQGNWNITTERTVALLNPPPIISPIPDWEVVEGVEARLDISAYVSDENDPDDLLTLFCDQDDVEVDGLVLGVRYDMWVPDHTVTLSVSDGENDTQANLVIHVINVNDPPEITGRVPENGSRFKEGEKVTFSVNTSDEDADDLTMTWWDGDVELGTGSSLEVKLKPGEHSITIVVDDGTDQVDDTFTVVVEETGANGEETSSWWVWALLIVIIIILSVVGFVYWRSRVQSG